VAVKFDRQNLLGDTHTRWASPGLVQSVVVVTLTHWPLHAVSSRTVA